MADLSSSSQRPSQEGVACPSPGAVASPALQKLRRWWFVRKARLKEQFPLVPEGLVIAPDVMRRMPSSWLSSATVDGVWGLGCSACAAESTAVDDDMRAVRFAAFRISSIESASPWNLARHARSKTHLASVRKLLGAPLEPNLDDVSPSAVMFEKLWDSLRRGGSMRSGLEGVGGQHKLEKMAWCLAEAMWSIDRKFLGKPGMCITLMRDERKQRLVCRFRAAGPDLAVRSGVIGQAKDFGTRSENITRATREVIKIFATAGYGAPNRTAETSSYLSALKKRICESIVHLVVDAASDELLGGAQLRVGSMDQLRPLCPNLKTIVRDRPHGSRRT